MRDIEYQMEVAIENIVNKHFELLYSNKVAYTAEIILGVMEIHIIDKIENYGEQNITQLSALLGLSKSTVSRKVSSLQKKGYVKKFKNGDNKKDVYLRLTDLGKEAFYAHEEFHKKRRYLCYEKMTSYSSREKELILEFLTLYSDSLTKFYDKEVYEQNGKYHSE